MLERMKRLRIRNSERRATVAVNLDRERQKELERIKRMESDSEMRGRTSNESQNGVKFRETNIRRSKSRELKLINGRRH